MARGPCHVRQHDIDVIYKAARKAGYGSVKVEIDLDRRKITATASDGHTMTMDKTRMCGRAASENEWDEVFDDDDGDDQAQTRK